MNRSFLTEEMPDGVILVEASAGATFEDAMNCLAAFLGQWPDRDFVWDIAALDFTGVSTSRIRSLLVRMRNMQIPERSGHRSAIIAPDDLSYGMMRMTVAMLGEDYPAELAVFRDKEEALKWAREERR